MTPTASDTCTLRDPGKPETVKCAQPSSYFRTDGLCPYHGKAKDGLCGTSPIGAEPGLRGGMTEYAARTARRKRWQFFLDGAVHEVPGDPDEFRRNAFQAARNRQISVNVWTDNGKTWIQAQPREAVGS